GCGARGVDNRRSGLYHHGLGHRAQRQCGIVARDLADADWHTNGTILFETGHRDFYAVGAGGQQRDRIAAVALGFQTAFQSARLLVVDLHLRIGQDSALGGFHHAADLTGWRALRESCSRKQKNDYKRASEKKRHISFSHCRPPLEPKYVTRQGRPWSSSWQLAGKIPPRHPTWAQQPKP